MVAERVARAKGPMVCDVADVYLVVASPGHSDRLHLEHSNLGDTQSKSHTQLVISCLPAMHTFSRHQEASVMHY